jgi:hypothetical protein
LVDKPIKESITLFDMLRLIRNQFAHNGGEGWENLTTLVEKLIAWTGNRKTWYDFLSLANFSRKRS